MKTKKINGFAALVVAALGLCGATAFGDDAVKTPIYPVDAGAPPTSVAKRAAAPPVAEPSNPIDVGTPLGNVRAPNDRIESIVEAVERLEIGLETLANAPRNDRTAEILEELRNKPRPVDADEPFLGLLIIGVLKDTQPSGTTSRAYDIVYATAANFVGGDSTSGEAKGAVTDSIKFKPTGKPVVGKTANGRTATPTIASGAIAISATSND